MVDLFKVDIK